MSKRFLIFIGIGFGILGFALFLRFGNIGTQFFWSTSNEGAWLLPLVGVSALIDSMNPCAFSILLLTIAFLFSIGVGRYNILTIGIFYIAGIFAVYFLIGLGILQTLHIFNTPHFMAKLGALLLIILGGINVINEFFPSFPIKLRIPQGAHHAMARFMEKGSLGAAFFLGNLVGLCEFPCTGGPYVMVLGLLHDKATYMKGLGYLFMYNGIFILPLVIILFIASNRGLYERVLLWQKQEKGIMRWGGGVIMILLGIAIFIL